MRVLVTGGAGYVGSVLVPMLLRNGYAVRVVDCGWFGLDHVDPDAELVRGDVLHFEDDWLANVDAVIHLAGLSNDPMAAFSPTLNYMLNATGPAIVAQAAKEAGIRRFIFSSTCSIYGMDDSLEVTEEHPVRPKFPYAISKLMAERVFSCLEDDQFRPIVLRKGTVVGWSPRMRFDLVTNAMVKSAITEHRVVVHSSGLWRPLIDVQDASNAYLRALEADLSISGIFNIAARNYRIDELAVAVAQTIGEFSARPQLQVHARPDVRSYRVNTDKAGYILHFQASKSIEDTVRGIIREIASVVDFEDPRYYNIEQMKRLIAGGELTLTGPRAIDEPRVLAVARA